MKERLRLERRPSILLSLLSWRMPSFTQSQALASACRSHPRLPPRRQARRSFPRHRSSPLAPRICRLGRLSVHPTFRRRQFHPPFRHRLFPLREIQALPTPFLLPPSGQASRNSALLRDRSSRQSRLRAIWVQFPRRLQICWGWFRRIALCDLSLGPLPDSFRPTLHRLRPMASISCAMEPCWRHSRLRRPGPVRVRKQDHQPVRLRAQTPCDKRLISRLSWCRTFLGLLVRSMRLRSSATFLF